MKTDTPAFSSQFVILRDGESYSCTLYPEIFAMIQKHSGLGTVKKGEVLIKFVGFVMYGNQTFVSVPKQFAATDEELNQEDFKIILASLLKYRRTHRVNLLDNHVFYGDDNPDCNLICVAIELLDDFIQNGFLSRQQAKEKTNIGGRTDWNKTIRKFTPIFSRGQPIYDKRTVKQKRNNTEDKLTAIHQLVLRQCLKDWGWFYRLSDNIVPPVRLNLSKTEMIRLLEKEQRSVYRDRELKVIRLLIQYLKSSTSTDQSKSIQTLATLYFQNIWESVCGYVMENCYPQLSSLLPQPKYVGALSTYKLEQRPDIFTMCKPDFIISDAKYYNYETNVPGWHDVVKQFFYYYSLNTVKDTLDFKLEVYSIETMFNIFLLPESSLLVKDLGNVQIEDIPNLGSIRVFAINTKKALSAYAFNDRTLANHIFDSIVFRLQN